MTVPHLLRTERLELRFLRAEDAGPIGRLAAENLEHLVPWIPWAARATSSGDIHDSAREFVETARAGAESGSAMHFTIHERAADHGQGEGTRLVGCISAFDRVGPRALEIGYWIDHARAGRGIATEAAGLVTRAAFDCFDLVRVHIHVSPDNAPSLRVPQKLGFTFEGVLRKRFEWVDGSFKDTSTFTLLDDEVATSPVAAIEYEAFDEHGNALVARAT